MASTTPTAPVDLERQNPSRLHMQAVPHGIARWCLTMYEFAILVYLGIMHVRAGRGDEFRSIGTFIGLGFSIIGDVGIALSIAFRKYDGRPGGGTALFDLAVLVCMVVAFVNDGYGTGCRDKECINKGLADIELVKSAWLLFVLALVHGFVSVIAFILSSRQSKADGKQPIVHSD